MSETEQTSRPVLEVKNLSVLIKDRFLVKNVSFSMQEGECWGLLGENQSGKTSLIKAIAGTLPINPGQVFIEGKDIYNHKKILTKVATCFDPPVFFKYQTVYDNMKFISSLSGTGMSSKDKIIQVLNKFGLAHKMKTKVLFLSYYEKKIMSIALAFLMRPKLLFMDEPFRSVPEELRGLISNAIQEIIQENGTAVILTSRKIEEIEKECNNFIFMENREVKKIMTNEEVMASSELGSFAFVRAKYPHYAGKLIMENFGLPVKLQGLNVLFQADEDTTADIVKLLTKNRINVHKAGYLRGKAEKIFAELTPYYKEEK